MSAPCKSDSEDLTFVRPNLILSSRSITESGHTKFYGGMANAWVRAILLGISAARC